MEDKVIRLCDVGFTSIIGKKKVKLLDGVSCEFPPDRHTAVLVKNLASRNTLLKILMGVLLPETGFCQKKGLISWPPTWINHYTPHLTVSENLAFISRLYGYKAAETVAFVRAFSDLDREFQYKFADLDSESKKKVAFLATLAIPFDYYLFDGDICFGDEKFKETCTQVVMARMQTSSCILISSSPGAVTRFTNLYVLEDDGARFFSDATSAVAHYKKLP